MIKTERHCRCKFLKKQKMINFHKYQKLIPVTHATESVHTIGKTVWKSLVRRETKSVMHFLWRSIIIPNLFTDGAATQQIKKHDKDDLQEPLKESKSDSLILHYLKPFMRKSLKKMLSQETSLLTKHLGKISCKLQQICLVHCPSCIGGMQMQKTVKKH